MDFALTKDEEQRTSVVTNAAYNAWVLVNDYFSWEKEVLNYEANGSTGEVVSAIFLFMKWRSIDAREAKRMLRAEIMHREQIYCDLKADMSRGETLTEKVKDWFKLLDLVTAGNFAWSMTTARYNLDEEDSYPALRFRHQEELSTMLTSRVDESISGPSQKNARTNGFVSNGQQKHCNGTTTAEVTVPPTVTSETMDLRPAGKWKDQVVVDASLTLAGSFLSPYEDVSKRSSLASLSRQDSSLIVQCFTDSPGTLQVHSITTLQGSPEFCHGRSRGLVRSSRYLFENHSRNH